MSDTVALPGLLQNPDVVLEAPLPLLRLSLAINESFVKIKEAGLNISYRHDVL